MTCEERDPGDEHQARPAPDLATLELRAARCSTHHAACDCRELARATVEAERDRLLLRVAELEERSPDAFQRRLGEWGDATFPRSTYASKRAHLGREVEELSQAIDLGAPEAIAEEAADCLMLLLHIMHQADQSLWDAAQRKFTELQLRRWGQPDAQGVVEHVRE